MAGYEEEQEVLVEEAWRHSQDTQPKGALLANVSWLFLPNNLFNSLSLYTHTHTHTQAHTEIHIYTHTGRTQNHMKHFNQAYTQFEGGWNVLNGDSNVIFYRGAMGESRVCQLTGKWLYQMQRGQKSMDPK